MKYLGNIDLEKPVTLNGKPHGVEWIASLPTWTAQDEGRMVYIPTAKKLYLGRSDAWEELTEGNVGAHNHNDLYYGKAELTGGALDTRYYTQAQTDTSLANKANLVHDHAGVYAPASHSNTSHSEVYITASGVSYEALFANGDVGSGESQVASGTHNHDTVYAAIVHNHDSAYSPIGHNHDAAYAAINHNHDLVYAALTHKHDDLYSVLSHNHDLAYATIVHNHNDLYYGKTELDGYLATKASSTHNHDTVYAAIDHKHDSLYAAVDHNHDGRYSLENHNHDLVYATLAHNHNDLYYGKTELDGFLSAKASSTHTHTEYAPYATEVSGIPTDTTTVGTMRLDSDGTKLYIYTSTGWKTATLA